MKNLKKIAALVIVLAMALSTVAFGAAFTDVAEDASYNEAVEVMSALSLLKGYEDGTFGPDKTITRAEFAAVVVRMLGMEDAAAGAAVNTIFSDVTAAHWGAGYVQVANQQGIIAGYGDGTFGPDDEVTYEQAVKMIVCALGYDKMFENTPNAYPGGYISQANVLGITVGAVGRIGDKATRAIVAKLAYNALDVKLMEQTTFGSDNNWSPVNKTLLSKNLKVAKVKDAKVEGIYFDAENANKVSLKITNIDNLYVTASEGSVNYSYDEDENLIAKDYLVAEGLDLVKGYASVAYIDFSDDKPVVLSITPKAGKNKVLALTGVQTEKGEIEDKGDYVELTYFENEAEKAIRIEDGAAVYANKNADTDVNVAAAGTFANNWKDGDYKEITLIDNDDDAYYDVVYVTSYYVMIVDTIYANTNSFKAEANTAKGTDPEQVLKLDPEDENLTFVIKDATGKELSFADVKKGDVLNVFVSENGSTYYKEVIVTNGVVEGTVTEKDGSEYVIGGEKYTSYITLATGETGSFVVDMNNTVIKQNIDQSNVKFGALYGITAVREGTDYVAKATIYTTAGEFVTFDFAKYIKFNSVEVEGEDTFSAANLIDGEDIASDFEVENDLVMYCLDASDKIAELYVGEEEIEAKKDGKFEYVSESEASYSPSRNRIAGAYVADSSVIIASSEETINTWAEDAEGREKYSVTSKALFNEDDEYEITAIYDGATKNIILAFVFNAAAKADKASAPMYVTSVSDTTDDEGLKAKLVKGYVEGVNASFVIKTGYTNIYSARGEEVTSADVTVGSVVQFAGEGTATAVNVLLTKAELLAVADDEGVIFESEAGETKELLYAGKIDKFDGAAIVFADGEEIEFDSATFAMVVRPNDDEDDFTRVYGNKYLYSAETNDSFAEDDVEENGDIVVIYSYDEDSIGAVIIDTDADYK